MSGDDAESLSKALNRDVAMVEADERARLTSEALIAAH
jgi:hypothetical protein